MNEGDLLETVGIYTIPLSFCCQRFTMTYVSTVLTKGIFGNKSK